MLIWGSNFILAEVALRDMAPLAFSVSRFVVGGAALVLLFQLRSFGRGPSWSAVVRGDGWRLLAVAILGAVLAPWLGIEGLGLTHGARASLWLALGPVASLVLGGLMRTERLRGRGVGGSVLAGLGTLLLAWDGLQPGRSYWLGDALLLLALLCAVAELHLIKPLARTYGAASVVTLRTLIGGALYALVALPSLVVQPWLSLGPWVWVAILAGGAVGVGLGQWVKVRALDALGPTRVVLYGNLVPVAALGIAWVALSRAPSLLEAGAAVLILGGAVLVQQQRGDAREAAVPLGADS